MTVARITEISATSTTSFDDAMHAGIERASKTLQGIKGAWVEDQNIVVENGKITLYQIKLKVTFVLKD